MLVCVDCLKDLDENNYYACCRCKNILCGECYQIEDGLCEDCADWEDYE